MLPSVRPGPLALFVSLALSVQQLPAADPARKGVDLQKAADKLVITLNGELFTEYHFGPAPHVYFYPVLGPSGQPMTRNAPMKMVPGEDADHPHHRSIWFSHGDVNGIDFWAETPKSGKIVHDRFIKISPGEKEGSFRAAHKWIGPDGAVVCTDETYFRLLNTADHRLFDLEVTIKAPEGKELVLGDTKEGTMAIRLAETMRLKANKFNAGKPGGHIVQSTGARDNDTWGKRAEWCDYSGPVNDTIVGVAIFDHPSNPRHPTWWHVRDYGLFAANPFGVHDFEKKPAGTGALKVAAGKTVTFRYRFYLHPGDHEAAGVAAKYREWAGSAPRHVSLQP